VRRRGAEDARLERWGAWRVGAGMSGAPKVATWAGLRAGARSDWAAGDQALPRTYCEERETHELITLLAARPATADLARFALAAYPTQARLAAKLRLDQSVLDERRRQLWRLLARLLSQRQAGEPLDPTRRRRAPKAVEIRATVARRSRPTLIASVVHGD